ncbi:MAG: hypothetical protein E3J90_00690 [Promethearchaeota archaeon]|nr:MAG: hypothetical protein E3J90_00690 [Candidatus Lokiarchaeota archaeon]
MSSGKAGITYSIEILGNIDDISVPVLPVLEKKYKFTLNENYLDHKLTKCYGKIVNVHSFLLNNEELTNTQKLDYCSMERYFMKAYLKEMMKKV